MGACLTILYSCVTSQQLMEMQSHTRVLSDKLRELFLNQRD